MTFLPLASLYWQAASHEHPSKSCYPLSVLYGCLDRLHIDKYLLVNHSTLLYLHGFGALRRKVRFTFLCSFLCLS
jgi:hypothetical protein